MIVNVECYCNGSICCDYCADAIETIELIINILESSKDTIDTVYDSNFNDFYKSTEPSDRSSTKRKCEY